MTESIQPLQTAPGQISSGQTTPMRTTPGQTTVAPSTEKHEPSVTFYAIGFAINFVLISAYFIWAYKQWKKPVKDGPESRNGK